jgi:hypothetical protein
MLVTCSGYLECIYYQKLVNCDKQSRLALLVQLSQFSLIGCKWVNIFQESELISHMREEIRAIVQVFLSMLRFKPQTHKLVYYQLGRSNKSVWSFLRECLGINNNGTLIILPIRQTLISIIS